jgi:hypothetical protein
LRQGGAARAALLHFAAVKPENALPKAAASSGKRIIHRITIVRFFRFLTPLWMFRRARIQVPPEFSPHRNRFKKLGNSLRRRFGAAALQFGDTRRPRLA